ncbi:MAG TPA: DUF4157 domain-containing protein [Allocoleopsis sp.]
MFHRQQRQISQKGNKPLEKQEQRTHTTAPQVNGMHPATLIQRAKAEPSSLSLNEVLTLQKTVGNRATTQLLAGSSRQRIQPKLTIGEPGDKYEQEADRVAAKVVQQMNAPASSQASQSESVQRQEREDDELMMKPMVQRQSDGGMAATPDLEASINQARGSGQPLADNIREPIEQTFGADFSGVKVHTDSQSDQLNQSIQARAFTTGQDIFFRQGEYNPGSRGGQELLAHELTHVVQQNGSAVQLAGAKASFSYSPTLEPKQLQKSPKSEQQKTVKQEEKEQLQPLAEKFLQQMRNRNQEDEFLNLNEAGRREFILANFPVYGMRAGDLVEVPGLMHMEEKVRKDRGTVLTSVKLRFRTNKGMSFQERAELDGLLLDAQGRVANIVSAKLNPTAVAPAQDRLLLTPFYDIRQRRPNEKDKAYRKYLKTKFPNVHEEILSRNNIVGMNVEYKENGEDKITPLEVFQQRHPLLKQNVNDTPVIGLTPKPNEPQQGMMPRRLENENRRPDNILLKHNQQELLDALAELVVKQGKERTA